MLDGTEKALCRKIAKTFELASKKFEPYDFTKKWLASSTSEKLYEIDCCEIAQSPLYQLNSVTKETTIQSVEDAANDMENIMYWVGYILTYFSFEKALPPRKISENYDIEKIFASYDTLHTTSPGRAIQDILLFTI